MSMKQVNLMHILLLGPTMIYAGSLTQKQLKTKDILIDLVFGAIVVYALFIPFIVRNKFLNKKIKEWSQRNWTNFFHYILFFGLFLYIGLSGRNITKFWQIIAIGIGLSQIGIHSYLLLTDHKGHKH